MLLEMNGFNTIIASLHAGHIILQCTTMSLVSCSLYVIIKLLRKELFDCCHYFSFH